MLLAVAVILPTVCLLWFMSEAVKNERLAVRQKLLDVYTKRAQNFFVEVLDNHFDSKIEHLNSLTSQEPYLIFNAFAIPPYNQFAGMLIFDANNKLAYPILDTFTTQDDDQLTEPFQKELADNFEEALKLYEKISEETTSEIIRHKAMLYKARCLSKLDRKQEAIELVRKVSLPVDPGEIDSSLAGVIMHARVFLVELCRQTDDKAVETHIYRILGHDEDKVIPFVPSLPPPPAAPAETIIWQLDKLIDIAGQAGLSDKIQRKIESAKSRIEAYQNAILAAYLYPDAKVLNTWPDQTIRKISPEPEMYGMKFKLFDKTILGIFPAGKILKILNACVSDMQDDTISVQVYNNLGQFVAGDNNLANEPFLKVSPGKYFPDFKVAVHFKDNSVFENAAGKQAAIYTWTGVLVIVLVLATGGFAGQAVGKQIRINRLKNDFIATVSHELKTPLASMRVLADTLLEGNYKDQKQATEYLQLICKENKRLSGLIDNFLTFSRMGRNKHAFVMVKTSPAAIAHDAADAVKTKFSKGQCKFEVNIREDLPDVLADHDAMVTVLVNLLDNAYKYSENGRKIELRVFAENGSVCFCVCDKGIGMSRRSARKIFKRFYQADRSLSRGAEGCGLGLSIAKFIVDAHKGTISIDSKPGEGSTFIVKLPQVN